MLSEPKVLARTKEFMLSDAISSTADTIRYATVDTQFRKDEWQEVGSIEPEIRDVLSPFNHVSLGSGYPDMVFAGPPPAFIEHLDIPQDSLPVIAVEAKGETKQRTGTKVPVKKAILQAYDRLSESNASIATVPSTAITGRTRQLARELDIGLLAVTDNDVAVREPPVPKGVATDDTASAVRWQAGAQRIADQSFHYNHPKTYLGIPLVIASDRGSEELFESNIVRGFKSGKSGAKFLGLVRSDHSRELVVTSLGKEVIRFALRTHGTVGDTLEEMDDWGGRGKQEDLIEEHRGWGEFTRNLLFQYPATPFLVDTIEKETPDSTNIEESTAGPTLPELVQSMYDKRPAYTVELFIRQGSGAREKVFSEDDSLSPEALKTADVYQSTTVYQFKMMLRHSGILHSDVTASSTDRLTPATDYWTLRNTT